MSPSSRSRSRTAALRIAAVLVLVVVGDLATMFADRAKPVNRKDFSEAFFAVGNPTGDPSFAATWPEVNGWFVAWFAAIEVAFLIAVLAVAVSVVIRGRIPMLGPWVVGGFLVFAVANLVIPFGSAIEWERLAALYVSVGLAATAVVVVGIARWRGYYLGSTTVR